MSSLVIKMHKAMASLQSAINDEVAAQMALAENDNFKIEQVIESTPADISARYWLMQLLQQLSTKDLKSVVDGFLVQMLNEEQAKKLVKFLLVRFPNSFKDLIPGAEQPAVVPAPAPAAPAPAAQPAQP